jgi:hypothetical protein
MYRNALDDCYFLKLFVDPQYVVWYADKDSLPVCSNLNEKKFLKQYSFTENPYIRVAGLRRNINLISSLFSRKCSGEIVSLQVCSPFCCYKKQYQDDPEIVLYSMREFSWPSISGGWHEFTPNDYSVYSIYSIFKIFKNKEDLKFWTRYFLKIHTAWPLWSLVHDLDELSLGFVLSEILDPRWFFDFQKPLCLSKLYQYFGLNKKMVSRLSKTPYSSHVAQRFHALTRCWKNKSPTKDTNIVSSFFWKFWCYSKDSFKADFYTNKKFLTYVVLTWMDSIVKANKFFDPEIFFKDKKTVKEYVKLLKDLGYNYGT